MQAREDVEFLLLEQQERSAVLRVQDISTRRPPAKIKSGLLRFVRWNEGTSSLLLELATWRSAWAEAPPASAIRLSITVLVPSVDDDVPFACFQSHGDASADAIAERVVASVNAAGRTRVLRVVAEVHSSFRKALLAAGGAAPVITRGSNIVRAMDRAHLLAELAPALLARKAAIKASLTLLASALVSKRWTILATPLPPPLSADSDPQKRFQRRRRGESARADVDRCVALVRNLGSIESIVARHPYRAGGDREYDAAAERAAPIASLRLLHWLLDLNHRRPRLRSLSATEAPWWPATVEGLVNIDVHEFVVEHPSDAPLFEARAAALGTIRGYHGTALDSAHAIAQSGLRNMSGTKGQTTGAIFGDGVYLAMQLSVAATFAPHTTAKDLRVAWRGTALGRSAKSIATVFAADVVDDPSFRQATIAVRGDQQHRSTPATGGPGSSASASSSATPRPGSGDGTWGEDSYLVVGDVRRNVRVRRLFILAHEQKRKKKRRPPSDCCDDMCDPESLCLYWCLIYFATPIFALCVAYVLSEFRLFTELHRRIWPY